MSPLNLAAVEKMLEDKYRQPLIDELNRANSILGIVRLDRSRRGWPRRYDVGLPRLGRFEEKVAESRHRVRWSALATGEVLSVAARELKDIWR